MIPLSTPQAPPPPAREGERAPGAVSALRVAALVVVAVGLSVLVRNAWVGGQDGNYAVGFLSPDAE